MSTALPAAAARAAAVSTAFAVGHEGVMLLGPKSGSSQTGRSPCTSFPVSLAVFLSTPTSAPARCACAHACVPACACARARARACARARLPCLRPRVRLLLHAVLAPTPASPPAPAPAPVRAPAPALWARMGEGKGDERRRGGEKECEFLPCAEAGGSASELPRIESHRMRE